MKKSLKEKMILPSLDEAKSPYWRPIKYSLFPPLGLATLAAYFNSDDDVVLQDQHVGTLDLTDTPDLVCIQVYVTNAFRAYAIADGYRARGVHHLLDWRLGLDLARLAHDTKAKIVFTTPYWNDYVNVTFKNVLLKHGYSVEHVESTLIGENPYGESYCLVHPLWSSKYIKKLIGAMPGSRKPLSVYDVSKMNNWNNGKKCKLQRA